MNGLIGIRLYLPLFLINLNTNKQGKEKREVK